MPRCTTRLRFAKSIRWRCCGCAPKGKADACVIKVGDESKESSWPVDKYSQHRVCDKCGRSFDELEPHHFSFNSPLGWCPVCQGLGVQHGANPAVLNGRPFVLNIRLDADFDRLATIFLAGFDAAGRLARDLSRK